VAVTFVTHEAGLNAIMDMASPSYKMRFMYMAGYEDEDEFDRFKERFTLAPVIDRLIMPVLIQGGEDDELSPIECSEDLASKLKSRRKFVIYEGERHAIGGNSASYLGENWMTMLCDWCRDRIDDKPAPNERVHFNSLGQATVTPY